MKDFHKQMIAKQGEIATVDKVIQEHIEYIEKLRDFKTLYFIGAFDSSEMKDCIKNIQEERVDCSVMDDRVDAMFNFTPQENKNIATTKINRTIERYLL